MTSAAASASKSSRCRKMSPILFAAKALGRPIKWTGSRAEHFLSDNHSRDADIEAALALDADGNFTALHVAVDEAMGAYLRLQRRRHAVAQHAQRSAPMVYRTPVITVDVRAGDDANTNSVGPYRGAGREQAALHRRAIDRRGRRARPAATRSRCAAATMIPPCGRCPMRRRSAGPMTPVSSRWCSTRRFALPTGTATTCGAPPA